MADTVTAPSPIRVDCYGRYWAERPRFCANTEQGPVEFIFDPEDKAGIRFHLGLFLDYDGLANRRFMYPKSRRIALLNEPRSSHSFRAKPLLCNGFACVLTHDRELLAKGDSCVAMPFGTSWIGWPDVPRDFNKTKLVSFMGAEHPGASPEDGHYLRNQVIQRLRARGDVACFGRGIQWVDSKLEAVADFAFSVATENCRQNDYFTEKLIDCFLTDTVPIYWGCDAVCRYFDDRGMLRFDSIEELDAILDSLSWDRYRAMLPFVQQNKQTAIRERLASMQGLYDRVADVLAPMVSDFQPVSWRPRVCRLLLQLTRPLRHGRTR